MGIKEHSLLVSFTCNKPQLTQKDDKATRDAEQANNAHGAGQFRKSLYPKQLIAPILGVESAVRAYIQSQTYPWSQGEYLLPTARFMQFSERIGRYEIEFNQSVTAFLNNWSNVMMHAQQQQGSLFDASAYPDMTSLRNDFRFRVLYRPVTDVNDFRVVASEDAMAQIRATVEAELRENNERLLAEPLKRLREHVERLREVAQRPDRKVIDKKTGAVDIKPPIFRDSVVDNIIEEIKLLREFEGVLPDTIMQLAQDVHDQVPGPQAMRDSPQVRAATVTISDALLASIDDMLRG